MLIGMQSNVICRRTESPDGYRWQLLQHQGTAPAYGKWEITELTPEIGTDEMHLALLCMGFPTSDVERFLLAVNHPDRVPMHQDLIRAHRG